MILFKKTFKILECKIGQNLFIKIGLLFGMLKKIEMELKHPLKIQSKKLSWVHIIYNNLKRFLWGLFLDFFAYAFTISTPVLIYLISNYICYQSRTTGENIMWIALAALVRFLRSFFDGHSGYTFTVLGADAGNTLALGMVKKSLNYSVLCNKNFKMG